MEQLPPPPPPPPYEYRPPPPVVPAAEGPPRWVMAVLGAVLVVLVGAAIAVPLVAPTVPSAAAVVRRAVASSLARHTADVTVAASIREKGRTLAETAAGQLDFADGDGTLDITMVAGGTGLEMQGVLVAHTLYLQVPGIPAVEPGKAWVSVGPRTLTLLEKLSPTAGLRSAMSPLADVRSFEQAGATVRPIPASPQGGTSLQGYQLVLSRSRFASWASKKAPANLRALKASRLTSGVTLTIDVSATGTIASVATRLALVQDGARVAIEQREDFSTYGTAVTVTAPPPAWVVGLRQFDKAARSLGTSVTV